jgi:hypothetical protein
VDFEMFCPDLDATFAYSDGAQGERPPCDPVMMFKVLVKGERRGIRPIGRTPTKSSWKRTASSAMSIARSRRATPGRRP